MKIIDQKAFARELIGRVQGEIIDNVSNMPSDWDGHEIRQYIADRFAAQVFKMEGARARNYRNTVLVANL